MKGGSWIVNNEEMNETTEALNETNTDVEENTLENVEDTAENADDAEENEEAAVEDAEKQDQEASEKASEKKSWSEKLGKKEKKSKKDPKDTAIEELSDKYTRLMAEFENFRKRTEKEKSAMYEIGAKSIIEKILPVIDNFERGLATVTEEEKENSFVDGMDKVYKQFVANLEEAGVKPIEAVGKEFNLDIHNAVMHVEDEEADDNIVVEEYQKGYMYKDSVIRHSMVKVAN